MTVVRPARSIPSWVVALGFAAVVALLYGAVSDLRADTHARIDSESVRQSAQIDARANDLRGQIEVSRALLRETESQLRVAIGDGDSAAAANLSRNRDALVSVIASTAEAADAALAGRSADAATALERAQTTLSSAISDVTSRLTASQAALTATATSLDVRATAADLVDARLLSSLTAAQGAITTAQATAEALATRVTVIENRATAIETLTATLVARLDALAQTPSDIAELRGIAMLLDEQMEGLAADVRTSDAADLARAQAFSREIAVLRSRVSALEAAAVTTTAAAATTTATAPTTTISDATTLGPATTTRSGS